MVFSKIFKTQSKERCKKIGRYEKTLTNYAKKKNGCGIICGHIHASSGSGLGGGGSLNWGGWVESCNFLGGPFAGCLGVIDWGKNRGDGGG